MCLNCGNKPTKKREIDEQVGSIIANIKKNESEDGQMTTSFAQAPRNGMVTNEKALKHLVNTA